MTLHYATSFGGYQAGGERTDLEFNWSFPVNVDPTEAGIFLPARGTGRGAFIHETGSQTAEMTLEQTVFVPFHETWVVGCAFRIVHPQLEDPPPDRLGRLLGFVGDQGFEQFRLVARAGTLLVRMPSGTIAGVADVSLSANVWYYLEVKAVFHPFAGAVELRVDEQPVLTIAGGLNTRGLGNTQSTARKFLFAGAHEARVDVTDIYIADGADATATQGRPYNHFLGDIGGKRLTPAGSGSSSQFFGSDGDQANNYQLVDDDPTDGDVTYVESAATSASDLYTFTPLSATPETIEAVIVESHTRDSSGVHQQSHVVKSGAAMHESGPFQPALDYRWHQTVHTNDPNAGDRWTQSTVSALQAGPKVAV